jgi:phosphate/sulfate permease
LTLSTLLELPGTYLAGGIASLAFTALLTRRGVPVSASIALVGGLAGAADAESGWRAIGWGGVHGVRPYALREAEILGWTPDAHAGAMSERL